MTQAGTTNTHITPRAGSTSAPSTRDSYIDAGAPCSGGASYTNADSQYNDSVNNTNAGSQYDGRADYTNEGGQYDDSSNAYNQYDDSSSSYNQYDSGSNGSNPCARYTNAGSSYQTTAADSSATITATKVTVGGALSGGEFEFALMDGENVIATAYNDANGKISFPGVTFSAAGDYNYTIREISPADDSWDSDASEFSVTIHVTDNGSGNLTATASYPGGLTPVFKNYSKSLSCGLVEFGELTFTEAGTYVYHLKELAGSADGWLADDTDYRVVITVEDDGHGNLVASAEYPDGYPQFVNTFAGGSAASFTITACKIGVGGDVEDGQFEFGLFEDDGAGNAASNPIDTATNSEAGETETPVKAEILSAARKRMSYLNGRTASKGVYVGDTAPHRSKQGSQGRGNTGACSGAHDAIQRKLRDLRQQH